MVIFKPDMMDVLGDVLHYICRFFHYNNYQGQPKYSNCLLQLDSGKLKIPHFIQISIKFF